MCFFIWFFQSKDGFHVILFQIGIECVNVLIGKYTVQSIIDAVPAFDDAL